MSKISEYIENQDQNCNNLIRVTLNRIVNKEKPLMPVELETLELAARAIKQKNVAYSNLIKHEGAKAKYKENYQTILD